MPIRFRCAYCNQLMSISRRKAGAVVPCPKCAGEIIVPTVEGTPAKEETEKPAAGTAFEDPNFNPFAEGPFANGAASATQPAAAEPAPAPPVEIPPAAPPPRSRVGVFVPLGMLIVAVGVVILLLIFMLVIGLIIGRHTVVAPDAKNAAASHFVAWPLFSGTVKNPQRSA